VDAVWYKTAQIYDYEEDPNGLVTSIDRFSRYKTDAAGKRIPKNKLANHCWKLWHANVITWDGLVVPCCFDKDALYSMGNVQTTAFETIFKNQAYQNFRQTVLKGRQHIDICQNCSEGCKVWKH
jgi:radical SAM protein with 4Fe4S-binding SPASM domain